MQGESWSLKRQHTERQITKHANQLILSDANRLLDKT